MRLIRTFQSNQNERRPTMTTQFITVKQVAELYSVSRTTIWDWCKVGGKRYRPEFPKPYKLDANSTRWNKAEIIKHMESIMKRA